MRDFTIERDTKDGITILSYGNPRTGKTRFAATFPRPYFLFEGSERGWQTVQNMDPSLWHDPEVAPRGKIIEHAKDLGSLLPELENEVRSGQVSTVIMDSYTCYADMYLNYLQSTVKVKDGRQHYQFLYNHLRWLTITLNQWPCNVIWNCHESVEDGRKMVNLPRKEAEKFPGRCDYVFYFRKYQDKDSPTVYEIRTRGFDDWPVGGRDEGMVPDPLPECNYAALAKALRLDLGNHKNGKTLPTTPGGPVVEERKGSRTVVR